MILDLVVHAIQKYFLNSLSLSLYFFSVDLIEAILKIKNILKNQLI